MSSPKRRKRQKGGSELVTCRIPWEISVPLRAHAAQKKITTSALIVLAIQHYMQSHAVDNQEEQTNGDES